MVKMRVSLVSVSLLVAGACASAPQGTAQDLIGCYYFEQDAAARELNLPWGVELKSDSLTSWPPLRRQENVRVAVTLLGPNETGDFPFGYWQVLGDETGAIRLGYPGMGGFTAELTVEENQLSGLLGGEGDVPSSAELRATRVRLVRARCPN